MAKRIPTDVSRPLLTTYTLNFVAGIFNASTVSAWRSRHGLFGGITESWANLYSIVDVCVLRAIVVLTSRGIRPQIAIPFAEDWMRPCFERLLTNKAPHPSFAVCGEDEDFWLSGCDDLRKTIENAGECAIVVDLIAIVDHVRRELDGSPHSAEGDDLICIQRPTGR